MPIVVKDKIWSQTPTEVHVTLALNGTHPNQISDVFISEKFIKVNYKPYYFEAFLFNAIDASASKCKIFENNIKFLLKKQCANVEWDHLECEAIEEQSGSEILDLKKSVFNANDVVIATQIADKRKMKADFKRQLVDMELNKDQEKREKVEAIHQKVIEVERKEITKLAENENEKQIKSHVAKTPKKICPKATSRVNNVQEMPSIRQFGTIEVNFTERRFATPQRESQAAAEQEWILKQNDVKKEIGFCDDDLRPEERNPKWLLDKGNEFHQKGNYKAAISAYSTGINISKEPAILHLNRAVSHFAIENYNRCAIDTSKAYDLFVPAVPSNLQCRIRCLSLRGAALIKLGFLKQGHTELLAAKKLDPLNQKLQTDIEMVENELRTIG